MNTPLISNTKPELWNTYGEWLKNAVLHDLIVGNRYFDEILLNNLHIHENIYQVVIYENFEYTSSDSIYDLEELLNVGNHDDAPLFYHFKAENHNVVLLCGKPALDRLQNFIMHYQTTPPQKNSPMDSLFLAYGRPVKNAMDLHLSFLDASTLISRRFFCERGSHILGFDILPDIKPKGTPVTSERIPGFCTKFCDYLQVFNRKKVAEVLHELEICLAQSSSDIPYIKVLLSDLYLQIKERMNLLYSTMNIPFGSNSEILAFFYSRQYLYEILEYLLEQFEMIMRSIGGTSRDSVLNDILYYIQHNYRSNLKLETIAPLFGYNSAYLGKIFNKAVGESFNTYLDRIRIEHSKELLQEKQLKVYEISEQVGYKNVDYFHKKFKKYVGMSPAEFRRLS